MRPSLLKNRGDGRFADATREAGLLDPVNSNAASWADYNNDGWLDLFVACERQPNRLYRNKGDGTFEEVAAKAGLSSDPARFCKGCAWLDYDNDRFPDLFLNNMEEQGRLYHNERDGRFTEVTSTMGIDGPTHGFSCWSWDYDNDGWLDIFATCYDHTLPDVVLGLMGKPHSGYSNRLFRNLSGKGFQDMTSEAGLDMVFASMGTNYGDFDNDGFLDMYLGTGDPDYSTLVPNRMFRNVEGKRFADISSSSRTGHLQKGHGVSCGDWDRDGDIDILMETGGAVNGDKYHNVLFQNPGQGNHWLTLKLIGRKTNRSAIGARIRVVTGGERPMTVRREVSTGSSFGANPLQQTIGLSGYRPGRGAGDRLADERDEADVPRYRRGPGHRGDRVRGGVPETRREADPPATFMTNGTQNLGTNRHSRKETGQEPGSPVLPGWRALGASPCGRRPQPPEGCSVSAGGGWGRAGSCRRSPQETRRNQTPPINPVFLR